MEKFENEECNSYTCKEWKKAGNIELKNEKYESSLICYLNELKLLQESENQDKKTLDHCKKNIIKVSHLLIHLTEDVLKEDFLIQLYIIGCSLHRDSKLTTSIHVLQAGIDLCKHNRISQDDDSLNTDDVVLMKLHFEIASCKELNGQLDDCISDYRTSIFLAVHHKDVSFEKMVLLRYLHVLMEMEMYEDAAAGYLRVIAISSDIWKAVNGDMTKYRDHWSVECECEVRYNLSLAFKSLQLYEMALDEALHFKLLIDDSEYASTTTPNSKTRSHDGITYRMQANCLVGKLYELLDDLDSALVIFQEWLSEVFNVATTSSDTPIQMELASAYQSIGEVLMKLKKHDDAAECFEKLVIIGKQKNLPQIEVVGILYQGDIALEKDNISKARDSFLRALKLAQASLDDYSIECKCISKEAETYAKEGRYSHALYQCERALHLGRKSDSKTLIYEVERQAALYSQHSTSKNELMAALKFLVNEVRQQEQGLYTLTSEGVNHNKIQEKILYENYNAIQVILHRLGENKLSIAFCESQQRHRFLRVKKGIPQLPVVDVSESSKDFTDTEIITTMKIDEFLLSAKHSSVISFTILDSDFLAHVMKPGLKVTYSYMLSDHVVNPGKTMEKIRNLVQLLNNTESSDPSTKLVSMYNSENRSVPDSCRSCESTVKLPNLNKATDVDGAGDTSKSKVGTKQMENIQFSKSLASKGLLLCEGETMAKSKLEEPVESSTNRSESYLLEELYTLLILPLQFALKDLQENSTIYVIANDLLGHVPFDHLFNPINRKAFGEEFNVISVPCLLALDNSRTNNLMLNQRNNQAKSPVSIRNQELLRSYQKPGNFQSLQKLGFDKSLAGLVSTSATGTNVITSPHYVTPYYQESLPERACLIGNPDMPHPLHIHGKEWKPRKLLVAQQECKKVAQYLDVFPVTGENATKTQFLRQIKESTLIHICTYGSIQDGLLVFKADSFPHETPPFSSDRYMVTVKDLLDCKLNSVKLAVLSLAGNRPIGADDNKVNLPYIFMAAGVQCVLYLTQCIPDKILQCFYYHFYQTLQHGSRVSKAVYLAKSATRKRYPAQSYWNAIIVTGCDVSIDLSEIRKANIHRSVSQVESNQLDAQLLVDTGDSPAQCFCKLQKCLAQLSGYLDVSRDTDVIPFLLGLVEEATDRLTQDTNSDKPIIMLPEAVASVKGTIDILSILGFDFQGVSLSTLPAETRSSYSLAVDADAQMIVFPHWNQDSLLLPTHQALTGLYELCANSRSLTALALMLPLGQDVLCRLIDLLAIVHHTPDIQLRISDPGIRTLWQNRRQRDFLKSIGIDNVRSLLVFYRTVYNKSLLVGSLQLLLSVSQHRSNIILERLDIASLGKLNEDEETISNNLKSVDAVLMPRNEILLRSSWMADHSYIDEKNERKLLATEITDVTEKFSRALNHAKWWHRDVRIPQQSVINQASDKSDLKDDTAVSPRRKVKVQPGSTPSCVRIPVDDEESPPTNLYEVLKRREEARYILHRRCVDIDQRHASSIRDSYLPFTRKLP